MLRKIFASMRNVRVRVSFVALVSFAAAASPLLIGQESKSGKSELPPGVIFSTPLPDVPGKQLVVVDLKWGPTTKPQRVDHRHPGSVYVHVTEGTLRIGIEGEPVQEIPKGGSFFEPAGALHTVAESASSTEPASAIAVMIVPEGAPLITVDDKK